MVSTRVERINVDEKEHCVKSVTTDKGDIECEYVINAAAIYADEIAKTVGLCDYRNYPRTGEFYVLDKKLPYAPSHIIAPLPTPLSRGKLITPTINGNMLIGPSAVNGWDKEDTKTDKPTLDSVLDDCRKMIPAIDPRDSVTQFTGVRPAICPKTDWRVRANEACKGYIEAVGISQGISGSPGVAKYIVEILDDEGLKMVPKDEWNPERKAIKRLARMDIDLKAIEEVIEVAKRLDDKGLVNAFEGNISIKRGGKIYITPTGKSKATLTPEKICVMDSEGKQIAGIFEPTSELKMHTAVYKMRDDISGIVHAHPPFMPSVCGESPPGA